MEISIAQVSQTVLKNDVAAGFTEKTRDTQARTVNINICVIITGLVGSSFPTRIFLLFVFNFINKQPPHFNNKNFRLFVQYHLDIFKYSLWF